MLVALVAAIALFQLASCNQYKNDEEYRHYGRVPNYDAKQPEYRTHPYKPKDKYIPYETLKKVIESVFVQNVNKNKNKNQAETKSENESYNDNINNNDLTKLKKLLEREMYERPYEQTYRQVPVPKPYL